jgi:cytoskeletal protein CcmA (bactofilin family)
MDAAVNIGPSIEIKGELSGNEDLIIDGKVDGKIVLQEHSLTIGANAKIKADVRAKSVLVIGEVFGNITADDKIEIASSGSVEGDLTAPRVALADGSSFKGGIDMACKTSTVGQTPSSVSPRVTSRVPMAASPSK